MTINVLIVDDSPFICKVIRRVLEEDNDFKVVGIAYNGQEAIQKNRDLHPDVITMDVEMPIMDGIAAVKAIMTEKPTPILMFSAMTQFGAKATLDALSAGAIDFLPKQLEDIDQNRENAKRTLRHRIRTVALQAPKLKKLSPQQLPKSTEKIKTIGVTASETRHPIPDAPNPTKPSAIRRLRLLVIVASTGGPVAVQQILSKLPARCPLPVLLVQHMPSTFTKSFAERLDHTCHIQVREALHGEPLQAGLGLLAPGGMQMELKLVAGQLKIELSPKSATDIYAPCADITLRSVAQCCPGQSLTVVLTGMGSDGKEGAKKLKQGGAMVWAQNEESCVIYGMPKAIVDAKLADRILSLDEIGNEFSKLN